MKQNGRLITISWHIYRLLLALYPASFRQTYGREMALVFRDQCRRKEQHGGATVLLQFWLATLIDLVTTVFTEHVQEMIQMPLQIVARLCGFIGALGGLSLLTMLYIIAWAGGFAGVPGWPLSFWYYPLNYALPLAVGTIGLYLTYNSEGGIKQKVGLLLALMGTLLMALDVLLFGGWLGQGIGMALHGAGLLLLGLSIQAKVIFLRPRKLLMLIGLLSLALITLLSGISGEIGGLIFLLLLLVYGAGWLFLGLMLALAKTPIEFDSRLLA